MDRNNKRGVILDRLAKGQVRIQDPGLDSRCRVAYGTRLGNDKKGVIFYFIFDIFYWRGWGYFLV
ncbi:hypothetical protein A2994_03010 [candidate division Kazan bacterium RIFCSPLOWO2_01_FULL_48_13]|uniref:Uncharacterized protein n=1 Tax=candidate division Kazan bacterium RIFCSPLOWO2_01_FULL_48_13 TaxID=1798539 RepID=A0A1F4PPZ8_UNCK3|nr:MAG: hypothetical protein A2994_03010 [candidate division Kazan bacterium RIFCSPLOWO2_01_FULL_48_13]